MSIEQVNLDIMNVNFTINTPSEEKATLLQAVEMLNKKSDAIKESGRIVGTDKIVVMAALKRRTRPLENHPQRRFGNR